MDDRDQRYLDARYATLTLAAAFHRNLKVQCGKCRYVRIFKGSQIWWWFAQRGWDDNVRRIASRFYCTRCKRTWGKVYQARCSVTSEAPIGWDLPEPDERTWKQMTRRMR